MSQAEYVLGLWDGHDSGAALLRNDEVLFAINEERLTRRKLEVHFPRQSIAACLKAAGIAPADVREVVFTTTDFAKTLTRVFPSLKEAYYQIRRRKIRPGQLTPLKKRVKYRLTHVPPNALTRWVSERVVRKQLVPLGLGDHPLRVVDHQTAHAGGALFSGFKEALVLTLDGIGDGLSGAAFQLKEGKLEFLQGIPGRDSFGLFFEHVTNLMNMRELEDEGKVMALANFAYPVPDEKNPMMDFLRVEGTRVIARYGTTEAYKRLKSILWEFPAEQFCYMAQRTLEVRIVELVKNLLAKTGLRRVALSGGVASNIKANRLARNLPGVEDFFVFPHMGDGGQALGAACVANSIAQPISTYRAGGFLLGPSYTNEQVEKDIRAAGWAPACEKDIVSAVAELLARGEIVFWFQGRMEYGPRALGARSILALPGSLKIKDELNLKLKKRVWYQPFCPSMLEADAREILEDLGSCAPDRYMASAYKVKDTYREKVQGVINVDGTCRPQILADASGRFGQLLLKVKEMTGLGVLLNTSMNIHGEPLACSPNDALRALAASGAQYLAMEDFLVRKPT